MLKTCKMGFPPEFALRLGDGPGPRSYPAPPRGRSKIRTFYLCLCVCTYLLPSELYNLPDVPVKGGSPVISSPVMLLLPLRLT